MVERVTALVVGAVMLTPILVIGSEYYKSIQNKVVCTNEYLPFETVLLRSQEFDLGANFISTHGSVGEARVCKNKNGGVVTKEVVKQPINQIRTIGTAQPEPFIYSRPQQEYEGCPITTCNDGTCSSSTGRGTCSWHGGVAY